MARLFITPKEQQLIADLTKEFFADVVGQYIIYYPISVLKTQVHPIYDEAIEKIFDNPIKVDVLAGQPDWSSKWNQFGSEQTNKLEIFIQARNLIDKGFEVREGDFFVYDGGLFEIQTAVNINNVFGQSEYDVGYKLEGRLARKGQFDVNYLHQILADGPNYAGSQAQKTFEQQRGLGTTETEGATNDHRQVRERLGDEFAPIALNEGARKIKPTDDEKSSTFDSDSGYKIYDE